MLIEAERLDLDGRDELHRALPNRSVALEFQVVETLSGFDKLRGEWDVLINDCDCRASVFLQHSWIWHWWRTFLDERHRPAVVIGRRKGKLVLALPLVAETNLGVCTLSWMGDPVSQYSDVLCHADEVSVENLLEGVRFAAVKLGGDLLVASKVREDAAIASALVAEGVRVTDEQVAPAIAVHKLNDFQDIEAKFSARMRKNRRRKRKKLQEAGSLSFRMFNEGSEGLACVEHALAFKADWLERYAIVSNAYGDPRFAEFWRCIASTPSRPVGLSVSLLELDERPVAIEIGLRHNGVHCAHIGAFDVNLEKCSPGASQMDDVLVACIEDGVRTYDMLAPNADYKERLADEFVPVRDYVLSLSAKGRACDVLRLTESRGLAKAAVKSLPSSVRKVIKSTLGGIAAFTR